MYIDLITIDLCPGQGGGVNPSGTLEILGNGEYDVYSYASASVNVHPSVSLSETYLSNGSYNISGEFNGGVVTVAVPSHQFITETLSVSSNGTYTPGTGVDGFSEVIVDVSATGFTEKEITEGVQIVNLSNSASFVGAGAFAFNNLQTIDLSLCQNVGSSAFYCCYNLNNISLPVCETISNSAFQSCSSLSQVYLPVCKTISNSAFKYCSTLLEVYLPECEVLSPGAFAECMSLSYVSLPACRMIYEAAFQGAFQSAASSVNIVLPVCSYIGYNAFYWTIKISTITLLSDSVCVTQTNAFRSAGLTAIYVPPSLVDAYKSANGWSQYSSIILPIGGIPELSFSDGLLYGTLSEIYPGYIQQYNLGITPDDVVSVSLPDCTYIGSNTFMSHYNLTSAYIPNVVAMGNQAFRHCSSLTSIDLPICQVLGYSAFIGCNLLSISAPSLTEVSSFVFGNNYNLSEVYLPALTSAVSGTFNGCSALQNASLPTMSDVAIRMFDGCDLLSFTVAGSQIRLSAFNNNSNLSEIYLPGSTVTGLGNVNAFNGTPIGNGTGSIYVPWSLVDTYKARINWSVFASQIYPIGGYPELSFSDGLLYGSASTITKSSWTALGISSADIVSINLNQFEDTDEVSGLFSGCTNLTTVSLPACTTINTEMFRDCTALSNVYIPACTSIGTQAFENCTSLSELALSVCGVIGNQAFSSTGLTSLTIYTDSVCEQESAFGGTPIASGTGLIYVPYSLLEDYQLASHWSDYTSQILAYDPPVENLFFDEETGLVYGTASFIDSTYLDVLGITAEQVTAVSLPDCTYVGSSTFKAHPNLVSVSLPACTEVFGQGFSGCLQLQDVYLPNCSTLWNQAFFSCNVLNSITLDNCEVVSIGAFRYCYTLSTLSLPKATNLYLNCFADCRNLYSLYLTGSSVVTLSSTAVFLSAPTMVYVPSSMYESYLTAPVWSTITSRLVPVE